MQTSIMIYDSKSHQKVDLPCSGEKGDEVKIYACGPTVYNHIHIGNARTFLTFDVIRKWLSYCGYKVTFVQNITDVDDKIINRSIEEGKTPAEIAKIYTKHFIDAMDKFGIDPPDIRPKATEEISSMINLIKKLIDSGHAYVVDGDVYFEVRTDAEYGKLSGRNIDDLQSGARVEVDSRKRDPLDFALWKAAKLGEPSWDSPWGQGRPGWHIECSAMSEKYLGLPIDIHGGGSDLIFPHHENELAQSECGFGCQFAKAWVHSGMLNINEEKMSKSLGNFLLLKDVLESCDPVALRLLMLQTHYRSPLDFSDSRLDEAKSSLDRVKSALSNLKWAVDNFDELDKVNQDSVALNESAHKLEDEDAKNLIAACDAFNIAFIENMNNDFNTAGALGELFSFINICNQMLEKTKVQSLQTITAIIYAQNKIVELLASLGIVIELGSSDDDLPGELLDIAKSLGVYEGDNLADACECILKARANARVNKDWDLSDKIRDELQTLGLIIEDTAQGARVKLA
ncbi:MAG: cysteine--tRNA ligase [Coriobacteriales bacterium]|nr:cysteine--tRNA ligase [Coriobacteriales bacterium]